MQNKNFFIVIVILAAVTLVSLLSYLPARFDAAAKIKVSEFPKSFGAWTSTDIPVEEKAYEILETRNLFVREYKNPSGDALYLYVVYSEDNRKVSHPPEVCLMGSGVTITDKSPLQITDSIKATKLIVEKADARELVVYWYKAGALNTDKYLKQQLKVVLDRMFGKRTSGALIRISAVIKGAEVKGELELVKAFSREIEPLLAKYVP